MKQTTYKLVARVSSQSPSLIAKTLRKMLPASSVRKDGKDFIIEAQLRGATARDLNRSLLTELRRSEKRTRLRSEWHHADGTCERFFDYVAKKTTHSKS